MRIPPQAENTTNSNTYSNPLVLDDIVNGQPLLRVCLQHAPDEILGVLGDLLPLGVGKLVLTRPNSLFHSRRNCQPVVAVERGKTTKSGKSRNVMLKSKTDVQSCV